MKSIVFLKGIIKIYSVAQGGMIPPPSCGLESPSLKGMDYSLKGFERLFIYALNNANI